MSRSHVSSMGASFAQIAAWNSSLVRHGGQNAERWLRHEPRDLLDLNQDGRISLNEALKLGLAK